ncbi:kinase-like protein [Leucogyrophana mollusca]|uniref:Kinase-like protein n=1 Tax=Leucogyrophana mollusca TaxID=85980 RepID=A0ACB8BXF8_9AGAM|nr:kinase-like protein [Leucogyrophana mollusca]
MARSSAQAVAQVAPVPWIAPAMAVLVSLIDMFAKASSNKNAVRQLQDRCFKLLIVLEDNGKNAPEAERTKALIKPLHSTLEEILERMKRWSTMSAPAQFIKQDDMAADIQTSHMNISDCLTNFQVTSHLDIHAWQEDFEANRKLDHDEIIRYLSDIQNTQVLAIAVQNDTREEVRALMTMMQKCLPDPSQAQDPSHGLEVNLYRVQKATQALLPNLHLKRGEVRRLGQYPVGGNGSMDIWEGMYLNEEKVAIKVLRAVHADPRSHKRFKREVDIWKRVWEVDHGEHTLPLYGFCQTDGPFPYIVSPWQPNGNAITYVKKYPDVDHRALIIGITEGILVLHSMSPPVVHGDLKGANIVIDATGKPLIADFGFSKVIEDITGEPVTQSTGVSNSHRWLSPELCFDNSKMNIASDVYAYSMTVLELMTHEQPWATVRNTPEVVIRVDKGERPKRPEGAVGEAALARGLDDHLWGVMQACWANDPAQRPRIGDVLRYLTA